jgi:hypothetical protein
MVRPHRGDRLLRRSVRAKAVTRPCSSSRSLPRLQLAKIPRSRRCLGARQPAVIHAGDVQTASRQLLPERRAARVPGVRTPRYRCALQDRRANCMAPQTFRLVRSLLPPSLRARCGSQLRGDRSAFSPPTFGCTSTPTLDRTWRDASTADEALRGAVAACGPATWFRGTRARRGSRSRSPVVPRSPRPLAILGAGAIRRTPWSVVRPDPEERPGSQRTRTVAFLVLMIKERARSGGATDRVCSEAPPS